MKDSVNAKFPRKDEAPSVVADAVFDLWRDKRGAHPTPMDVVNHLIEDAPAKEKMELGRQITPIVRYISDHLRLNRKGKLYEVEIPDENWLHWDETLDKQPHLKESLEKAGFKFTDPDDYRAIEQRIGLAKEQRAGLKDDALYAKHNGDPEGQERLLEQARALDGQIAKDEAEFTTLFHDGMSGEGAYNKLAELLDPQGASQLLHENGIVGNKYLDGISRKKREGSYNYVVFDDKTPKISNKYMKLQKPEHGVTDFRDTDRRKSDLASKARRDFWARKAAEAEPDEVVPYPRVSPEGTDEQLVNLNTGADGPMATTYTTEQLQNLLAREYGKDAANRYMKKRVGAGSEGSLQGGSRKEGNELGLGRFRSDNLIENILNENAPEPTKESWNDWIVDASKVRNAVNSAKNLDAGSTPAEVLAARESIIKSANRIARLSRQAADMTLTPREEYQLLAEMARNADMQDALRGVRSNAARIVNSFKIDVETNAAFTDAIRNMMKKVDNTVLSDPKQRQKLFEMIANSANNQEAVNKIIKDSLRSKAEDYIFRVWYNMLLSGPATHVANLAGTGGNFVSDLLENTGAAIIGQGRRFSNADRVRGREVAYRVWGALQALRDANTWKNTRDALNTGTTGNQANAKAGASHVYTGDNPAAGLASGFLESPSRALAGADEWWRNVLQLSNLYGLAVRNAGNKGLKGKAFWDEAHSLIKNPTKEMIEATNDYTKVMQFLDKPSWIGQSLINAQTPNVNAGVGERVGKGILKVAVPFVRTPDSLIRAAIRRTGVLSPLERETINDWKAGGASRDKAKSRLIIGSAVSFWLATQAYKGTITGDGPSDPQKKQEWLGSHQPNSIKVGDKWYSIAGLEPVSTNITAIATLAERAKAGEISGDDYGRAALSTALGIGSVLSDISYLDGFHSLMEMDADDPKKAQNAVTNFIANTASSLTTPAILRKYAQGEDPAVRDTTGEGTMADRIAGRIMSAVPGLSDQLPQRYDVYGRAQTRNIAGPDLLSRTQTRMKEDDPVILELGRLAETTDKVLVGPPSKSNIKVNGVEKRLNAEEFQNYQHLSGYWIVESLRQEIATPEWEAMSDAEKIDEINDIKKTMREYARQTLFNPDGEVDETTEEEEVE